VRAERALRLQALKLLKRLLAGVAVIDGAAERGAEAVFEGGIGGAAVGAGSFVVEDELDEAAVPYRRG
jgi:hypothetical protein